MVRAVAFAIFLQWAGNNAMLPLLPLDVANRGGSDAVVGAVMAAYFAAAVLCQYPAGWLVDRVGNLPVFLVGQACYAAGALLFLAPVAPGGDIALRALQGAGAGGAEVAALALVAGAVPPTRRGRAFGTVYGAGIGGMAVGPLLGSLAGIGALPAVFVGAGVAAAVAGGPVLAVRGAVAGRVMPARRARVRRRRWQPSLVGALLAAGIVGLTSGLYEAGWTLLLHHRGAADWEVGLSWTLYAAPYAAMSRPAGWLADHLDRRRLAVGALAWAVTCCAVYPWLPAVVLLLTLAVGESVGFVLALPAAQSLLADRVEPDGMGRVQGMFAASQTGATALAAVGTGAMFAVAPWLPFEVVAGLCGVLLVATVVAWRPAAGLVAPQREGRVERETSRTVPGGGSAAPALGLGAAARPLGVGAAARGEGPAGSTR